MTLCLLFAMLASTLNFKKLKLLKQFFYDFKEILLSQFTPTNIFEYFYTNIIDLTLSSFQI